MLKAINKHYSAILVIIAGVGVILCAILSIIYFNANFNISQTPSFCSINNVIDCDSVAKSSYSRFLEVPLSLWGLGFYIFIIILRQRKGLVFILTLGSLIASTVLAYISSFIIQKVCLLCYALYLLNLLLFLVCIIGDSVMKLFRNAFSDTKKLVVWGIVAILAGIAVLVLINIYKPFTPKPAEAVTGKPTPDRSGYTIGKIGNTLGSKKAKLVIREFTDYECPYCSTSHKMMLKLTKEIKDIRVEHHDFPLSSSCNPLVGGMMHPNACIASFYAKAAARQGKFWDMATLLFENQRNLTEDNILKLAAGIGLNTDMLKTDANSPEIRREVSDDIQKAQSFGVRGTPCLIIGIRKYEGMMPYEQLKAKVLESL